VAAAAQLAIALWHLGELARSRQLVEASLALAAQLNHQNSIGYALSYAAVISLFLIQDYGTAHIHTIALQKLGTEHGLPQWTIQGMGLEAPALARAGNVEAAVEKVEYSLRARERLKNEALGALVGYGYAEVQLCAGRHKEALQTITRALEFAEATGERWMDSALQCLRGDCLLALEKQEGIRRASAC
jgi:tetratricopeptide (TPR) repeat protein